MSAANMTTEDFAKYLAYALIASLITAILATTLVYVTIPLLGYYAGFLESSAMYIEPIVLLVAVMQIFPLAVCNWIRKLAVPLQQNLTDLIHTVNGFMQNNAQGTRNTIIKGLSLISSIGATVAVTMAVGKVFIPTVNHWLSLKLASMTIGAVVQAVSVFSAVVLGSMIIALPISALLFTAVSAYLAPAVGQREQPVAVATPEPEPEPVYIPTPDNVVKNFLPFAAPIAAGGMVGLGLLGAGAALTGMAPGTLGSSLFTPAFAMAQRAGGLVLPLITGSVRLTAARFSNP